MVPFCHRSLQSVPESQQGGTKCSTGGNLGRVYTTQSNAGDSIPVRSGTDLFTAPTRSSSLYHATPYQTSRFSPEMGESDTPPSMAEGLFLPVTAPHDGLDLNHLYPSLPAMQRVPMEFGGPSSGDGFVRNVFI
jgi:hypothetical protein